LRSFLPQSSSPEHERLAALGKIRQPVRTSSDRTEIVWNLTLQYANLGFSLIQGIVLVPVYLRFLGETELGIYLIASGTAAWAMAFDPGVTALLLQHLSLALGRSDTRLAAQLVVRAMRFNLRLALILIGLGAAAAALLASIANPDSVLSPGIAWWLVFLSIGGVALSLPASCATLVGVALRHARVHALVGIWSSAVSLIATLLMLLAGWGVLAIPLGVLARSAVQLLWSHAFIRRALKALPADAPSAAPIQDVALPGQLLAWSAVDKFSGTFLTSIDLILVGHYLGNAAVTSYAITRRPVDLLSALLLRSSGALIPTITYLTGKGAVEDLNRAIGQAGTRILWLLGFGCLGVVVFLKPLIALWVGPQHFVGDGLVGLLALGLGVGVFGGSLGNAYWASGEAAGFLRLNVRLSALAIAGMVAGIALDGIRGMLVGALIPRLAFAAAVLPRRVLRALQIRPGCAKILGWETICVTLAMLASLLVFRFSDSLSLPEAWRGMFAVAVFLGASWIFSRRVRHELAAAMAILRSSVGFK
jgi:O-antigen/teichoic acid export membrane protein